MTNEEKSPSAGAEPRFEGSERRQLIARFVNDHEAALAMGEREAALYAHLASEALFWSPDASPEDRWGIGLGDARNCACDREA